MTVYCTNPDPSADLHIPVLAQLAPAQLPLGDALEPGPLEVVRRDAPLGCECGPLGQYALEHATRDPDAAAVLPDRCGGIEKTSLIWLTSEERRARPHTWREHSGAGALAQAAGHDEAAV